MDTNIKIMVVLQKLSMAFNNQLGQNINDLGLTTSEFTIMAHLNAVDREKTQRLGEVAFITSGTITYTVTKLVEKGYVRKQQDEEDKRVYWVELTEKGAAFYTSVFTAHKKFLDAIFGQFSEDEKLAFIEQMKYFGKKIESYDER